MIHVGILVSDNMLPGSPQERPDAFERDEQMSKLTPACANAGIKLDFVRWRQAAEQAREFAALLPLFVWDYSEGNEREFLQQIRAAAEHTRVLNPPDLLAWNADKSYLIDLDASGVPTIPTRVLEQVTLANVQRAFDEFAVDTLVIKPQVGGSAWRQVLQHRDQPLASSDMLPPDRALLQAFLPSVRDEGEYSLIFIDGHYSHALIKRPVGDDYRVQSIYGGTEETYTATASDRSSGERVLAALETVPLYARIDLLRGLDGELRVIELEMIEPYLYFPHAPGDGANNLAAKKLAESLASRLR